MSSTLVRPDSLKISKSRGALHMGSRLGESLWQCSLILDVYPTVFMSSDGSAKVWTQFLLSRWKQQLSDTLWFSYHVDAFEILSSFHFPILSGLYHEMIPFAL